MPAYWFMYNMYALARNAGKYNSRDKRLDKSQVIEYDFLAPDTIGEMFDSLLLFKKSAATAWALKHKKKLTEKELLKKGEELLEKNPDALKGLELLAEGFENSNRKVQLVKVPEAYRLYKELIQYYGTIQLLEFIESQKINDWKQLEARLPKSSVRTAWKNIGGQLIPEPDIRSMIRSIRNGKISDWDQVHAFYEKESLAYPDKKFRQAYAGLEEILHLGKAGLTRKVWLRLLEESVQTKIWMTEGIYESRAKDYRNPFRKMVYDTAAEMEKVIGKLKDNSFILQQQEELKEYKKQMTGLITRFLK